MRPSHRLALLAACALLAAHCATRAASAASSAPATAPADAGAPALGMCPSSLPAFPDPKAWTSIHLDHGVNTPLLEIMWSPDEPSGSSGSVQCHYDTTNTGYWSHPVLTSVFKVRQPDPTAWPSWHRMTVDPEASDHWLCSGSTDTAFQTEHCPFEIIDAVEARRVPDPRATAGPF